MGVIEDVLVKVENFIYLVNFVVLDMEEGGNVPLILGRSFLATTKVPIDVEGDKLVLRVIDEEMIVKVLSAGSEKLSSKNSEMVEQVTSYIIDLYLESVDEPTDIHPKLTSDVTSPCKSLLP